MSLSEEERKYILHQFLRNISHIGDEEYQRRVWIRGEGPEWDDFDESYCHFFDDGDPILKKYKEYGITDFQYELLMRLRNTLYDFASDDLTGSFISTPEWKKIMEMAKEILVAFNYQEKKP